MNWYLAFFAAVFLLWVFSSQKDRMAARVILLATVGSFLLTEGLTRGFNGPEKLIFPGLVETLTILLLLRFSPNRTGYTQAGLLVIAWTAHFLCYLDLMANTDIVYSSYENVLLFVAVGQIIAFHDTILHVWNTLGRLGDSIVARSGRAVSASRECPAVLHNQGDPCI